MFCAGACDVWMPTADTGAEDMVGCRFRQILPSFCMCMDGECPDDDDDVSWRLSLSMGMSVAFRSLYNLRIFIDESNGLRIWVVEVRIQGHPDATDGPKMGAKLDITFVLGMPCLVVSIAI